MLSGIRLTGQEKLKARYTLGQHKRLFSETGNPIKNVTNMVTTVSSGDRYLCSILLVQAGTLGT
jgi:hypothetical protein